MLSRKQFGLVQVARGLSTEETIARSGIPAQSFMVLMESDGRDGRDPSKLISQSTFTKLGQTLGLASAMDGLCRNNVIEWQVNAKQRRAWEAVVHQLRQDLFSDEFEMTVINRSAPFYTYAKKKTSMVFLHDLNNDVKLAITEVDSRAIRFLSVIFQTKEVREVSMSAKEFDLTKKLISNGVYRVNQFHIVLGGRKVRYTWEDVQAAAKEFNFTTDELIDMMVRQRQAPQQTEEAASSPEAQSRPMLRVAAGA